MNDTHESNFDIYIHGLLKEAGINAEYQHTSVTKLNEALSTASKNQTGEKGMPDFIAVVNGYVLVIENKADRDKLCLRDNDGSISLSVKATQNYALNGALFYAKKILAHGAFTKIFAFGNAGDSKHHTLRPLFVGTDTVRELEDVETFGNFSPENIDAYYRRAVLNEKPSEEILHDELNNKAKMLNEALRNYGQLGDSEKPLVVSAILLALTEQDYGFSLDQLSGDTVENNTDGALLFRYLENSLTRAKVRPEVKREKVIDQFTLIKNRPILNTIRSELLDGKNPDGVTPLKFFAEYLNREIYNAIRNGSSPKDYLGRFYGEFVRYSGGDGQTLGVIMTPPHITELFCDLTDLKADDVIFDPCCGTGGFLVAGMHRMLQLAENDIQRKHIKEQQIFGIEVRDDMFAIATTNMILRGDGQSNLTCEDFLTKKTEDIQLHGITVGFMNPPYSQAKTKETKNLSELNFISHLLDSLLSGGRAAVIVPVSVMIGKTKDDRELKADILKHHTLEGVISLNKDTFYGVGTVPCIALFTAGEPHPSDKQVKFINFQDDGWEVKMHRGLVETERAKDRKQYLLDCWRGKIKDAPSKFMVETTVEAGDEWLHSFYYYNDEIPTEKDFADSLADYLTFEFGMIAHGRGYLFDGKKETHT
ncbi:MAG: SAM-dependent DNA methyltransferase [Synergistaceae bacterium]|nr:SAM-dependent DNA methyltransferase [Synergistaceae bacterium]